jgi:hypothetical protein
MRATGAILVYLVIASVGFVEWSKNIEAALPGRRESRGPRHANAADEPPAVKILAIALLLALGANG